MVIMGLSFLEKEPLYLCPVGSGGYTSCSREEACDQYPGQYQLEYSLYNWNDAFDLECASKSRLGLIGSIFFIGWMLGALVFPRLADLWGRKPIILGSFAAQLLVILMLLLATNLETVYAALFILGLKVSPGNQVSYVLMLEFAEAKRRNCYGTTVLAAIGFQSVVLAGYYYLARDYRPMLYINLLFTIILFLAFLRVPESPRYYLARNKYARARSIFAHIAGKNKKAMFS